MTRSRRTIPIVALITAFLMVLGACTGGAADAPTTESQGTTSPSADVPGTTEGPAATQAPETTAAQSGTDPNATLVVSHIAGNQNLDPDENTAGNLLQAIFPYADRLVHQVPSTGELIPGLALSWSYPEPSILEMELRPDVVFHDGTPFNAEAVKANIERSQSWPNRTEAVETDASPIERVEVVDDLTVRFHAKDLSDPAVQLLWSILPANLVQNIGFMLHPEEMQRDDFDLRPVATGPFRVVDHVPGDRTVYERFEDYWDPDAAGVAELVIIDEADPETRLSSVRSGEADITFIEAAQIPTAEEAGLEVVVQPTTTVWNWWINENLNPALQDPLVRQAMNHAIDREALVTALTDGTGTATNQPFPPGYFAYSPEAADLYPYDPDRARELLAEAGFGDGGPVIQLGHHQRPFDTTVAVALKDMLDQVGFDIQLAIQPSGAEFFTEGKFETFIGRRSRVDPLQTLQVSFAAEGGFNPQGTTTERMTELLEAAATTSGEERTQALQAATEEVVRENMAIFLWSVGQIWVWRPGCVVGFEPPLSLYYEFRGVLKAADC